MRVWQQRAVCGPVPQDDADVSPSSAEAGGGELTGQREPGEVAGWTARATGRLRDRPTVWIGVDTPAVQSNGGHLGLVECWSAERQTPLDGAVTAASTRYGDQDRQCGLVVRRNHHMDVRRPFVPSAHDHRQLDRPPSADQKSAPWTIVVSTAALVGRQRPRRLTGMNPPGPDCDEFVQNSRHRANARRPRTCSSTASQASDPGRRHRTSSKLVLREA